MHHVNLNVKAHENAVENDGGEEIIEVPLDIDAHENAVEDDGGEEPMDQLPEPVVVTARERIIIRREIVGIVSHGPSSGLHLSELSTRARHAQESVIIRLPYRVQISRTREARELEEQEINRWHRNRGHYAGPLRLRANEEQRAQIRAFIAGFARRGVTYQKLRVRFRTLGEDLLRRELRALIEDK
ncbi:hypothetical protein AVEN_274247-1 [Araneus ventricosus]|uniref:Uncharacterized protein n=1 Tax=Araneus ventricosus TaxID=182803 RepID=A0A4Y2W6X1_ARAVE|nr:hypothetical protein AVEN_274247-1 [Araneus ventricosus]